MHLHPLPAGALVPGIAESNIRSAETVAAAIRIRARRGCTRSRAVTVVLPDPAVRVFMLDFDSLPTRAAEVLPVLRLRLRKMVPFDMEHAGMSYQVLSQSETTVRVLAAVLPGPVLAEYEGAVRTAGYEPGACCPRVSPRLRAIDSMEAVLAANLSALALTTSITSGQDLHLFRTVELPEEPAARAAEMQRNIAVAAAYYEDKLMARPRQLHYTGSAKTEEFSRILADPGVSVVDMVPNTGLGATTTLGPVSIAGISGALAGA